MTFGPAAHQSLFSAASEVWRQRAATETRVCTILWPESAGKITVKSPERLKNRVQPRSMAYEHAIRRR